MALETTDQDQKASPDPADDERPETCQDEIARCREALALAEKKLRIVGNVTRHDILNQMTAIMGYNELLLALVRDEKARSFIEIERRATDKVRRILAYSKVFQNIGTEPPRWQRLDAVVFVACEETDLGGVPVRIEQKGCSIHADPQIFRVFACLFDNAVRHGQTTTQIRLLFRQSGGEAVLIVEDDGAGIPLSEKEKIFERGYGKHTGWGLYVTREILSSNGMTIRETGSAGSGARFEIRFPADRIRPGP